MACSSSKRVSRFLATGLFLEQGRIAAAIFRSSGVVILMLSGEPGTIAQGWPRASTSWQSSVTCPDGPRALCVCLAEEAALEDLRGLSQVEALARHCLARRGPIRGPLDRLGYRDRQQGGAVRACGRRTRRRSANWSSTAGPRRGRRCSRRRGRSLRARVRPCRQRSAPPSITLMFMKATLASVAALE